MNAAPNPEVSIEVVTGTPDPEVLAELHALVAAGEEADGNPPLGEQTLLDLRTPSASGLLVGAYAYLGQDDDTVSTDLVGAAVAVRGTDAAPGTLEMVVHPSLRDSGIAGALLTALGKNTGPGTLRAWAHGNHEAAAKLAERFGYTPVRELWRMRMVAGTPVPAAVVPAGITIRAFDPATDTAGWVAANAAAFAHHPEQGALTLEDLASRMAEDWFDPAGFLLAVGESGKILGFHWTKVHPALSSPTTGEHQAIGEIYVVGVIPEAQGTGLGKVLTLAGIEYLDSLGLDALMLYVDADNAPAVSLYRKLGFTKWDVDVMYAPASVR
ncbi:mycothiol synthase [Paeniglutamicibacter psychrophenolicus]|uniref:mycothiol synthase n=1 Tax=Paeniglutamicibacter psychrophenolicus TaxID=257454 RepID=UPI00277D71A7|nr:mycothiol synthase [Paeniglutamicibacter psychrophenolicus]MDQ0095786.1 mycothiol synthase [Paeniglutamicibacter psychrophenolicus]